MGSYDFLSEIWEVCMMDIYDKIDEMDLPMSKNLLKHGFIEQIKWLEEEIKELFLYQNKYTKKEIIQAKIIIKRIVDIEDICIDIQIYYLIDRTLQRIKKVYPEFFKKRRGDKNEVF